MRKYLIFIVLSFFVNNKGQIISQDQQRNISPDGGGTIFSLPNIIPPSPTAYALGNYGNIPVGAFTGSPNISIPLITYQTKNITLPIELFYTSNGIKVDEISTNVGLGWNLNFGGVITRIVRDKPDEVSTHLKTPENVTGAYTNPITNQFLYTLGNGSNALDTEADLYSFNFNGNSGKFFYDQNGQPHIIDQKSIKIERIGDANGDGQDFLMILSTGEKYYFTEKERTVYRSGGDAHPLLTSAITAWYLTKIIHPNGDEIYLTYELSELSEYVSSQSQSLTVSVGYPSPQPSCTGSGYTSPPNVGLIYDNTIEVNGKRIISMSSNNPIYGTIIFDYETETEKLDIDGNKKIKNIIYLDKNNNITEKIAFGYLNTDKKRNFLEELMFKDSSKKYSFEYEKPNEFPLRLSKAQDHWGYYNGKSNLDLVPGNIPDYDMDKFSYRGANKEPNPNFAKIGMLKKIVYPTKGYTELEYEGNNYWGEKTILPSQVSRGFRFASDNFTEESSKEFIMTFPASGLVSLHGNLASNGIAACNSFANSGHYAGLIEVRHVLSDKKVDLVFTGGRYNEAVSNPYVLTKNPNLNTLQFNAIAGQQYKIILHANFMCSYISASLYYDDGPTQIIQTNIDTGGIRIKSTKDVDTSMAKNVYKRFYYAKKDDLNHSSGLKGNKPYYTDFVRWQTGCSGAPGSGNLGGCMGVIENSNIVLSSSSMIPLYYTGISSCLYPYVTISEGGDDFENGGEMKEFKVRRDNAGSNIWGSGGLSSTPWTNKGWDNGVELKSSILRKNMGSVLDIVQEKEYVYEKNDNFTFELKNFVGRKLYTPACGVNVSYPYTCTSEDINKPNNPCSNKAVGTVVNLKSIDNLNITEYRLISYWNYLKSKKITDYLNGVPLVTTTEYFYNNPSNYQLTHQKITSPDNIVNESSYKYAHEKGNQLMVGKNMVSIPLETEIKQTINGVTKTISKTETIYPTSIPTTSTGNLVLPLSVKSSDVQNGASSTEVTYDLYDSKGNLQQYTTKDGIPVSIIWGYNQTQPIAKIEGATYNQVSGFISGIITASNTDAQESTETSKNALIAALDAFRNLPNLVTTQITTYTYNPLIGVTSITPTSGVRENYIYDSANRLEKIVDVNGKVLKEYKYNYKN
ncbi:hypothetical protein D1632_08340 [Chryseobacterium nematophagum]|uniref:RHS repeat protein n=1 Tax=Chryseobacterium nematophagum TaxID=2305228 RepID=A0A3M7LBP5_9FLAO|nr:hypothetical protein [Chryseobacterium nematophagum]RMZ59629.1 hypothetical protein D1632_08340 [Chryseobacterium nematophagum]